MVIRKARVLVVWICLSLLAGCVPYVASGSPQPTLARAAGSLPATGPSPAASATRPKARSAQPVPPKPGNEAYDFTLQDLQGNPQALHAYRGKMVLLNFWATWCGPCRLEIPLMARIYREYNGRGLEIIAVNMAEDPAVVSRFAKSEGMDFTVLLDKTRAVSMAYYVRGIPTSVFLDDQGIIRVVHVGTLDEQTLRGYLGKLVR
jgi:thiol-disulfide isomerase/thioredoxin